MRTTGILAASIVAAGLAVAPAYGGSVETGAESGSDTGKPPLSGKLDEALRELMEQMQPALDGFLETLKMLEGIDRIEHYQRPEMLPNGDIIIRRREDAPRLPRPQPRDDVKDPATEPGIRT